ncbi:MAG: hypothetical protein F7B60_01240 [Desulfurococcales archaeon]|nr:hypothetical protein [Desulfurococcales archaeon]
MPECPRLDFNRVLKALKRTLLVYTYGIVSFIALDIAVFYLYKINTDLMWRLKVTIVGGILSIVWLFSWWLVIRWVERK